MWDSWDLAVEQTLSQQLANDNSDAGEQQSNAPLNFQNTPFFNEQVRRWLTHFMLLFSSLFACFHHALPLTFVLLFVLAFGLFVGCKVSI